MLRVLKVSGESLSPLYEEGDFVLVLKIPFFYSFLRRGDAIAFRHPEYGMMIKLIERISDDGEQIFVVGKHPMSIDSRHFGPIPRKEVVGKVIWLISKKENRSHKPA